MITDRQDNTYLGVGLYTPVEAQRLIRVGAGKLVRWTRGHSAAGRSHEALWKPEIEIEGGPPILTFRDLVQARVTAALIGEGLSAQKVRQSILLAQANLGQNHPFASARFRSDGRTLILQVLVPGEDDKLIDLFRGGQYVMRTIIEPSLKGIEFEGSAAARWFPEGRKSGIVLDPQRQFGHPIDLETGVPTRILASAIAAEGSVERAARIYGVPVSAVRRASAFEKRLAA